MAQQNALAEINALANSGMAAGGAGMAGAQAGQAMGQQLPAQSMGNGALPTPHPDIANVLAQWAQQMNPHVLGTLIYRALKQHGAQKAMYNQGGIQSVGGSIGTPPMQAGGTVGLDQGQPFGSANVNGKVVGQFGPQGQ